ncbi:protein kinase [Calothrix sp. FACHB-1219]|uniref:bifunctional serine/threonine protein kinase/MFS transporter n=1 Tax=unclassified Calothrix TaxID=2619626 RepID=UPI001686F0ED|nr:MULTISPECIES: bifunctional serine/threonine protein kinase/MFS transporter [unclassified Calothrix]MBD2206141.1 protein kinase [Calothrix sp. FACHB-168]MBD2220912.1 protein kinase [Calothrix sp. FACHB-1219]
MSLCVNPQCSKPQNNDNELFCLTCGSELLLKGRYRVMRQLGGGGFGLTFEVNEVRSNTAKVLKVLINNQQKAVELFQQEAEVLSQLDNPGIPHVERDGYFVYFPRNSQTPVHCLVMEKIVGIDLEKYMANCGLRPIDQDLALQWLKELVTILDDVHSQNFFHRDIKPPNIMLRATGELTLIDFGTARQVTATIVNQQGGVTMISSAGYTPVEQMNSQAVPQSDFFALGRTFVFLLTGKYPLDAEIYDAHNDELVWRNHATHISPLLADLLDEMMAHKPKQRPANTQMILQRLAEIEQILHPPKVRRTNPPGVAPTQQVNTPQPEVKTPAPTQPEAKTPAPTQSQLVGWGLWLQWVLASTVALVVGLSMFDVYKNSGNFLTGFTFICLSLLFGGVQWLILRRLFSCKWWVLVTALGIILGIFGYFVVNNALSLWNPFGFTVGGGTVFGASLGIMQWLVLRQRVSRAGWWIAANTVGGAVVYCNYYHYYNRNLYILDLIFAFAVFAMITGGVLVWLMRESAVNTSQPQVMIPPPSQPELVGWGFWRQWVLLNSLGGSLGFTIGIPIAALILYVTTGYSDGEYYSQRDFVQLGVLITLESALLGITQWRLLRRWHFSQDARWLLLTAVGVFFGTPLGFAFGYGFYSSGQEFVSPFAGLLMGGAFLGMLQWFVLRRSFSQTGWWVLANALGITLGGIVSVFVAVALRTDPNDHVSLSLFVTTALGFAVFGMITGGALIWLMRQPAAKA